MTTEQLLFAAAGLLLLTILSAVMNRRRGISAWSLVPWDYLMLLSAFLLVVTLGFLAELFRQG